MTPERHQRILNMLNKRQPDLTVCMEGVHKAHNLAAVVRTCDAIGVSEVHAVWKNEQMRVSGGIATGSQNWVDVHNYTSTKDAISAIFTIRRETDEGLHVPRRKCGRGGRGLVGKSTRNLVCHSGESLGCFHLCLSKSCQCCGWNPKMAFPDGT